ncbi:putative lipase 1 [Amylocarpus encephaloides]|uniref:Lipase 1 n=1 Tax=Amylocarpus encephaloides TaxID=45428 RepID=A0A9P7YDA3_9HELO|nr:putative lipase 1 [Amylocarpus encephaloides]
MDCLGTVDTSKPTSNKCFGIENNLLCTCSEDCLALDIIRPSTATNKSHLPVFVFLHGGEFIGGDKSDIDGTNFVINAQIMGAPFIFVAVNYRLSFLGFPGGVETGKVGRHNIGLKDLRFALQWVKQNIQDFGGQASGADATTCQLIAYGGTLEPPFRAMILDCGAATGLTPIPYPTYTTWQQHYDDILRLTNCAPTPGRSCIKCLQDLPIDTLAAAFYQVFLKSHSIPHHVYAPVIDGDFLRAYPSVLMENSQLASVPTFIGHTTDELIDRVPSNVNFNSSDSALGFASAFLSYVPKKTLVDMLEIYPPGEFADEGPLGSGLQWSRIVAVDNDLQTSSSTLDDVTLARSYQHYMSSFLTYLDPNTLVSPNSPPEVRWEPFTRDTQTRLVFSGTSQSGHSNIHWEQDLKDNRRCDYIEAHNQDFLR